MLQSRAGSNTLIRRSRGARSATLICRGTLPERELDLVARRLGEIAGPGPSVCRTDTLEVHATDEAAPDGAPSIADLLAHLAAVLGDRNGNSGARPATWQPAFSWIAPDGPDPVALWGMDPQVDPADGVGAGKR